MSMALAWLDNHQSYAILAVFCAGFAESIVLLAILVPSSLFLAGIGSSYSAIGGPIGLLWIAATAGAVLGDSISFAMGRYLQHDIPRLWPFRQYPALIERSHYVFHRWGWFAFILGKFSFGIRPFVSVTAGVIAMPARAFIIASVLSSLLWAGAALGFGFALAEIGQWLLQAAG